MLLVKQRFGFDPDQHFVIPGDVLEHMRGAVERGKQREAEWKQRFAAYEKAYPELAAQWQSHLVLFVPAPGAAYRARSSAIRTASSGLAARSTASRSQLSSDTTGFPTFTASAISDSVPS